MSASIASFKVGDLVLWKKGAGVFLKVTAVWQTGLTGRDANDTVYMVNANEVVLHPPHKAEETCEICEGPINGAPGWSCRLHGEGAYIDGCTCDASTLQAALRTTTKRLDDQVKINVQLKKDIEHVRVIAESRRRKVASLERQVDTYALALKSVDNAVNLARKAMREETGGRDRYIDTKSTNDPHQRIVDAGGQEQAATAG